MNRKQAIDIVEELEWAKEIIAKHSPHHVEGVSPDHIQMDRAFLEFADSKAVIFNSTEKYNHWKYTINGVTCISLTDREKQP